MTDTKYIVYENEYGNDRAIVFTDEIVHSEMAMRLGVINRVVGAGFVSCSPLKEEVCTDSGLIRDVGFRAYGESVSLGVRSREDLDDVAINEMFFGKDELKEIL